MKARAKSACAKMLRREALSLCRQGKIARGAKLLKRAAEGGDAVAQARLARTRIGETVFRDASNLEDRGKIAEAIKLYRKAARLGDLGAMLNLANLLDDKVSLRRPQEAVYWYKRGIKAGYCFAAYNLAMHHKNLGNRRWYLHWMRVAAAMGDPDARAKVRKHSFNG